MDSHYGPERNSRSTPPGYPPWLHPASPKDVPANTQEQRSRMHAKGAHVRRTSPFQTVQARGLRPRERGPVELGSNNFPPPPGPNKSQSSSQHPPQSCRSFPRVTLVSHPHTCGPACIRGQSLGLGPALLMWTLPPSANFYQKRPFSPRLLAVSQPAPKKLRLGFGPAIHAHPEPPV